MIRKLKPATRVAIRGTCVSIMLSAAVGSPAGAADIEVSGRLMAGNIYRVQERDPRLLTGLNANAIGLAGYGSGGNADDANTNYGKGDAVSRMVKAVIDVSASTGDWTGLLRVKGWHDAGLSRDGRPWGNVPNGYAAGEPLSDRGLPRLSQFSGVALLDAWVQRSFLAGELPLTLRAGQQSLEWGGNSLTPGGLEALNPRDLPGLHRAGAVASETVVPRPMLFGRIDATPQLAVEAYYQAAFRPSALDACGTLWSMSDYLVEGCDKVMSGNPVASDRMRLVLGSYKKRVAIPRPQAREFGFALTWRPGAPGTELGLYHARYNARTAQPGVQRSTRPSGSPLIAGDPDGRNMAFFTEYPEGLRITAATFSLARGNATVHGEVSYRARVPFMLAPADVMPAFLSPTAPSLLRTRINAVLPGERFSGFDLYAVWQVQFGLRREWDLAGIPLVANMEVVGKHARGLPAPTVLRYGRADIFGGGPVFGNCSVHTGDAARQCSLRGFATPNAWGYRLRVDARLPALAPQLTSSATALLAHDMKGWSGDMLLNEGRKSLNLALRFEYRERYLAELGYQPAWGGDYNQAADRDTASVALGVRF